MGNPLGPLRKVNWGSPLKNGGQNLVRHDHRQQFGTGSLRALNHYRAFARVVRKPELHPRRVGQTRKRVRQVADPQAADRHRSFGPHRRTRALWRKCRRRHPRRGASPTRSRPFPAPRRPDGDPSTGQPRATRHCTGRLSAPTHCLRTPRERFPRTAGTDRRSDPSTSGSIR